ncbi:hypothetical protein [Microbacterium gorillae]|uniref:hypothetical protein n=1 Tax=Microbacterium gorillae TaxID=1231063 RepID=UPI0006931DA5|nr:hypothetical protein [Microbacterium gorillae]
MTVRRFIGALIAGAAAGGVAWLLGVGGVFAVAWGILAAGMVIAALLPSTVSETMDWPPASSRARSEIRTSSVARLAWSFDPKTGAARTSLARRVRRLAQRHLAVHGLVLEDPSRTAEIDAVLGAGMQSALLKPEIARQAVEHVLALGESTAAGGREEQP